jgi:hypothetical protein
MSRTPRPAATLLRAGVAGAAAVVLLTACGGDGQDEPAAPAASDTAAGSDTAAAPGTGDFCSQAGDIDERVDAALSDLDGGDASLSDAFSRIAVELRGISAPAEIASDWAALAAGLDRMADALADVDIADLDSLDSLDEAEGDLTTAGDSVEAYLRDECGL